jgi:hypothetical protein
MTTYVAVLTTDASWALDRGGIFRDSDSRWMVPALTEPFTFCGREWVRATFDKAPADHAGQTTIAAPLAWCQ